MNGDGFRVSARVPVGDDRALLETGLALATLAIDRILTIKRREFAYSLRAFALSRDERRDALDSHDDLMGAWRAATLRYVRTILTSKTETTIH